MMRTAGRGAIPIGAMGEQAFRIRTGANSMPVGIRFPSIAGSVSRSSKAGVWARPPPERSRVAAEPIGIGAAQFSERRHVRHTLARTFATVDQETATTVAQGRKPIAVANGLSRDKDPFGQEPTFGANPKPRHIGRVGAIGHRMRGDGEPAPRATGIVPTITDDGVRTRARRGGSTRFQTNMSDIIHGRALRLRSPVSRSGTCRAAVRKCRVACLSFVISLVLVGPAAASDAPARLRGSAYLGDLPTLLAHRDGLFQDAASDLQVDYGSSGKRNLTALRAGDVAFATMALTPLVIDRLRDETPGKPDDPVILANLVHAIDLNHVVWLGNDGATPSDALAGGRIAVPKGTHAEFLWSLFAAENGLRDSGTQLVNMAIEAMPEALVEGRVDGAVVWRPWTDRMRLRFGERLSAAPVAESYTPNWVLVSRQEVVTARPALSRAVVRAYHEAMHRIRLEPQRAFRLYTEHNRVPVDAEPELATTMVPGASLDWSLLSGLLHQANWARKAGYGTKSDEPIEPLSMVTPGPLEAVAPHHVNVPESRGAAERGAAERGQ